MGLLMPCMGGWCKSRDKCAHYARPDLRIPPAERLCGVDEEPEPIRISRTDEHKARLAYDPRFAGWVAGSND